MEKEEVLSIELPKGAEYRRVEVTDGVVSIVYVKDSVEEIITSDKIKTKKENRNIETKEQFTNRGRIKRVTHFGLSSMPEIITEDSSKPTPLIGGTEVYQKDNGTDYWYCKIKNGRDEFVYIRFDDLTINDLLFDSSGKERDFEAGFAYDFMLKVWKALKNKPETKGVWLPAYEPSKDDDGGIQYVSGQYIRRDLDCCRWEMYLEAYSSENGSRMASTTTYFLLLLRWLKDGIATISQLAISSRYIASYGDTYELTGERRFCGFYDFVGNTSKIVKDADSPSGYSTIGGHDGYGARGLSNLRHEKEQYCVFPGQVGLLELIR